MGHFLITHMDQTVTLSRPRINSLDILRGLVIILMAIDHIRDMWALTPYTPEDMTQTTPGYFFTRWITHFCAPVFVFLAGTSIYLFKQKVNDLNKVARFLLTRGIWLIFIEIILVNWAWSWKMPWNYWGFFLQVIWVIGVCMIIVAGLIRLPQKALLGLSILIIAGHNLLNFITPKDFGTLDWVWKFLHEGGWVAIAADNSWGIYVAYPLIPWVGVIGAGYVFGEVMSWNSEKRTKWLWRLGLGSILLFLILRLPNLYGDTDTWEVQKNALYSFMDILNTQKYPPSLQFLLMTLGPSFLLLILFERLSGPAMDFLRIFGRVPFFFYALHFPVIHITSILYFRILHGEWFDLANGGQPEKWPNYYEPSLIRLYLVWIIIVGGFYFLCRWFNTYKSTHKYWWLKYI